MRRCVDFLQLLCLLNYADPDQTVELPTNFKPQACSSPATSLWIDILFATNHSLPSLPHPSSCPSILALKKWIFSSVPRACQRSHSWGSYKDSCVSPVFFVGTNCGVISSFLRSETDAFAVVYMKDNQTGNLNQVGLTVRFTWPNTGIWCLLTYHTKMYIIRYNIYTTIACDQGYPESRVVQRHHSRLHVRDYPGGESFTLRNIFVPSTSQQHHKWSISRSFNNSPSLFSRTDHHQSVPLPRPCTSRRPDQAHFHRRKCVSAGQSGDQARQEAHSFAYARQGKVIIEHLVSALSWFHIPHMPYRVPKLYNGERIYCILSFLTLIYTLHNNKLNAQGYVGDPRGGSDQHARPVCGVLQRLQTGQQRWLFRHEWSVLIHCEVRKGRFWGCICVQWTVFCAVLLYFSFWLWGVIYTMCCCACEYIDIRFHMHKLLLILNLFLTYTPFSSLP